MKCKITAKLETSDHDGYCSGNECEYKCEIIETIIDVPEIYKSYPLGKLNNVNEYEWTTFLPTYIVNQCGSCCCNLSPKSIRNGLGIHDYEYTILSVEIIE